MDKTEIIDVNKYTYIDPKTNHRVEAERDNTNVWSFEEYDERGNVPHMWTVSDGGITLWDVWGTFDSHDNTIYTHETTWKSGSIEELDTWFDYDESGNEIVLVWESEKVDRFSNNYVEKVMKDLSIIDMNFKHADSNISSIMGIDFEKAKNKELEKIINNRATDTNFHTTLSLVAKIIVGSSKL